MFFRRAWEAGESWDEASGRFGQHEHRWAGEIFFISCFFRFVSQPDFFLFVCRCKFLNRATRLSLRAEFSSMFCSDDVFSPFSHSLFYCRKWRRIRRSSLCSWRLSENSHSLHQVRKIVDVVVNYPFINCFGLEITLRLTRKGFDWCAKCHKRIDPCVMFGVFSAVLSHTCAPMSSPQFCFHSSSYFLFDLLSWVFFYYKKL